MLKKFGVLIIAAVVLAMSLPQLTLAATMAERLSGYILLQVESHGEAWYVYPENQERYYMGRPNDAFTLMRNLGLGIAHRELTGYLATRFPARLSGKIMLDVEQHGEAYYVYPKDLKGYYLGRPDDAFQLMRKLGLGITNADLKTLKINTAHALTTELESLDQVSMILGELLGDKFETGFRGCLESNLGPDYEVMSEDDSIALIGQEATDVLVKTCAEQAVSTMSAQEVEEMIESFGAGLEALGSSLEQIK